MDDILVAGEQRVEVQAALVCLKQEPAAWKLYIAPEKIQEGQDVKYLGLHLTARPVAPLQVNIKLDGLNTLNDFEQLLGHINWIRPYLRITTKDLEPLFSILHGSPALDSPQTLMPAGRKALELVQQCLQEAQVKRCDPTQHLSVLVIPESIPAALLWQGGPLVLI